MTEQCRLAAILVAEVVGYSKLVRRRSSNHYWSTSSSLGSRLNG
jgi:hypothetical protein